VKMKLVINRRAYQSRGITGFIGGILMIPSILATIVMMFALVIVMIFVTLCILPGVFVARIGAVRTPHLDKV